MIKIAFSKILSKVKKNYNFKLGYPGCFIDCWSRMPQGRREETHFLEESQLPVKMRTLC
jgi:hypothetical protein